MSSVALLINDGAAGDKDYKSTNSRITPKRTTPDIHHEDKLDNTVDLKDWLCTLPQWVFVALTILHYGFDINPITDQEWYFLLGLLMMVMTNILCAKSSKMYRYLTNIDDDQHVRQFVNGLREIPILIWWSARCYHTERRTTGTDNKTRTVEVTTHSARRQFEYAVCTDITGNLEMLDEHNVTMLRLERAYEFADDATKQQYVWEWDNFKNENDKDSLKEYHEELSIEGFQDRILAFSNDRARSKFKWMKPWIFLLFSACGLSPCFKCVVRQFCGEMTLVITKRIKR